MTDVKPTTAASFLSALAQGVGWGILAASICGGAVMAVSPVTAETHSAEALRLAFEMAIWTALVATILAFFPIGPIAGAVGWLIYLRGVRSPWAYALVGALSALVAPILIVVVGTETMRYAPPATNAAVLNDGIALALLAGFALIGAFAGFMAGRKLRG